jgi:hypothetical protein
VEICPRCRGTRVHRASVAGIVGLLRKRYTRQVPYRCATCGWSGWAPGGTHRIEKAAKGEPTHEDPLVFPGNAPDLDAIDRQLSRDTTRGSSSHKPGSI